MRLTFVDAGVLIAAARGGTAQSEAAMRILDDPDREFAASPFLRLEVIPQAAFKRRVAETTFCETFFTAVARWANDLDAITVGALREASECGVAAMDALHVAAAAAAGADELVTTERPSRSIHRARSVRVITIHPTHER